MPPKRDTTSVVHADYETINSMAVESRNEQKYRSTLFAKNKERNLDACGDKRMASMVKKAVKNDKNVGNATTKKGGMMALGDDDDSDSEAGGEAPTPQKRKRDALEGDGGGGDVEMAAGDAPADAPAKKLKDVHNKKLAPSAPAPLDEALLARSVHLSGLPPATEDMHVAGAFASVPGIAAAEIRVFRRGAKCRGGATVAFPTPEGAAAALALGVAGAGVAVLGTKITVEPRKATPSAAPAAAGAAAAGAQWVDPVTKNTDDTSLPRTLFIANVAVGTTKEMLSAFFEKFGPVDNVLLTQHRKSALLEYATEEAAVKALKATGAVINNSAVKVTRSQIGFDTYKATKTVHKGWQGEPKKRGTPQQAPAPAPVAVPAVDATATAVPATPAAETAAPAPAADATATAAATTNAAAVAAVPAAAATATAEKPKPKIKATIFSFKPRNVK